MSAPTSPAAPPTPAELFERVRSLELLARRNAASRLQGDYVTAFKGSGLLFEEPRRYQPGDPVRTIDWNITARLQEPYVRTYREERQRDVVLLLDVSPSMHGGFQRRTKLETAIELAATLAVSAIDVGDRLGWIVFADEVLNRSRPRRGKAQLWRTLQALLDAARPWDRPVAHTDPRLAIHELESRRGGPMVIFLISDFVDHDVPEDLRYLRPRHDASVIHVYDPFEHSGARDLLFPAASPEGDADVRTVDPGGFATLEASQRKLAGTCAGLALDFLSVSSAEPVSGALLRLFHQKRRRTA